MIGGMMAERRTSFLGAVKDLALDRGNARAVYLKAGVPAGSPSDPTWAEPLATLPGGREFFSLVERAAVITRAGFNRVPFATPTIVQTSRPTGYKVAAGDPKPVTKAGLVRVTLDPTVVGCMMVLSNELLRSEDANAEAELSRQMSSGVVSAANTALLDPNAPGSITEGVDAVPFGGTDDAALLDGLVALLAVGDSPVVIASLPWAVRIVAALRGADRLFPLIIAPEAGDRIISVDPRGVAAAIGTVDVAMAESATLQMRDDPISAPTDLVSMWQSDSTALRCQLLANWQRVRDDAVMVLDMSEVS